MEVSIELNSLSYFHMDFNELRAAIENRCNDIYSDTFIKHVFCEVLYDIPKSLLKLISDLVNSIRTASSDAKFAVAFYYNFLFLLIQSRIDLMRDNAKPYRQAYAKLNILSQTVIALISCILQPNSYFLCKISAL